MDDVAVEEFVTEVELLLAAPVGVERSCWLAAACM